MSLTSWIAITSKRETISAMQRSARQFLFGESLSLLFQLSVRLPKARRFHVAISRLRSGILGGRSLSSAACSSTRSFMTSSGGLSMDSEIVHSLWRYYCQIAINVLCKELYCRIDHPQHIHLLVPKDRKGLIVECVS